MADAGIIEVAERELEAESAGRARRVLRRARILGGSFFLSQVLILTSVLTVLAFVAAVIFSVFLAGIYHEKVLAEHPELEAKSRAWAQEVSRVAGVSFFDGADEKTTAGVYLTLHFLQGSQPRIRAVLMFGLCLFLVFGLLRSYVMDSPEALVRPRESGQEAIHRALESLSALLSGGLRVVLASGEETCCHRGTVYLCLRHFILYTKKDPEAGLFVVRHEVFHHLAGDDVILWASRLLSHFLTLLLTALLVLFVAILVPPLPGYLQLVPLLLLLALGYVLYRRLLAPYNAFATYHELLADDYAAIGQSRGMEAISSERCSAPSDVHLSADQRLDYQRTGATWLPARALAYLHILWITTFCFPASLGLSTFTPPWMTVAAIAVSFPLLLAVIQTPRPAGLEPAPIVAALLALLLLAVLLVPALWRDLDLRPSLATLAYALYTVTTYGLTLRK